MALKIMKVNYEQIVKAHQNQPGNAAMQVSDEIKFQVVSRTCSRLISYFLKLMVKQVNRGFPFTF